MVQHDMIEIVQQGLQDEMHAAVQYIAVAGKYGDGAIKEAFLSYAADELKHAQKLMQLLQTLGADLEAMPMAVEEMDDLYLYLIEYMAREESAVFYYEALGNLVQDAQLQRMCKEIQGEEQLHLNQIRALYQQVKEHA